jgi:hypothetical protein
MSKGGGGGSMYYPMPSVQSSSSNTSQSTTIPDWLTNASQFGINNAKNIVAAGTPQYNAPLAAGLNNDQEAAGQMIRDSIGGAQPYYDQAQGAIDRSMNEIAPATLSGGLSGISQYMNPYINNVVNSVQDLSKQNLDQSLKQTDDQAIAARAFGGSRHGVQEGVATAQNNLNTNNLIANLLQSGYNNATSLLGSDVQRQNAAAQQNAANALAGGNAMANLGTTARGANAADINNLLTYGSLGQQTLQGALDKNMALWQYQNQYPLQAQQTYNQTVSSAPHNTSSTGSSNTTSIGYAPQQQSSSSPLTTALGLGLGGLSMLGSGGFSGLGSLGLGLLGASPFPSSYSNPRMQ